MSTTKSEERKSRRSSILKAPKVRQPLQNVELNADSTENSPPTSTHKIKRRVSFAEKKHVKEFCDSMEQGTVWDSTYEESELSHRNSQNSNDENTATVEFPNESSKSHPRASIAAERPDESVVRESTFTGPKSQHSASSAENSSNTDLNPPAVCESAIEDSIFGTAPTRIPYPTNHFVSIKARRSLSASDCFAERNDLYEKSSFCAGANTCPTIDSHTRQAVHDDPPNSESAMEIGEDRNDVVPMEETMIGDASEPRPFVDENPIFDVPKIPSVGPIVDSKLEEEISLTAKISVEHEKFTVFHDTSMEITESVSNLAKRKSLVVETREESLVDAEISTFGTKTVEFREVVYETATGSTRAFVEENPISDATKIPSAGPMVDSKLEEEIAPIAKNSVEHEKFTIFHDTSMEITEAVSNLAKRKSLVVESREESSVDAEISTFGTKAVEFREVVYETATGSTRAFVKENPISDATKIPSAVLMVDSKLEEEIAPIAKNSVEHEKFTIFHDTSMEITEAVSNLAKRKSLVVESREESSVDAEISAFGTKAVEFREVVYETATGSTRAFVKENPISDATKIPSAGPMVDSKLEEEIAPIAKNSVEHEKFTIFHDTSMEITEAVSNLAKRKSLVVEYREESALVETKTAEFTEAVGKNVDRPSFDEFDPREDLLSERSICHRDKSMDFTEVVRTNPSSGRSRDSHMERTKIFNDESVDFSVIVGNVAGVENSRKLLMERTKIFEDKSVDFTNIVGNVPGIENIRKSPTEQTKIFHDKSMEFTDAVGNIWFTKQREKSPTERTKIFQNESVDFTNIVGNVPGIENIRKSPTEQTKIFHDKSMEFTDAVGNIRFTKQREKSPTERTKIFQNESVDFTNIVGNVPGIENIRKSPTERTKIFHDKSMEFTDAVGNIRFTKQREKSPTERTKIFQNESVDFTNIVGNVPGIENIRKSPTEQTKIFNDKSMEFTDAVGNIRFTKQREKSPTERTKIFQNESVDFTNIVGNVPGIENIRKSPTEQTKIFHDKSMEFTDAVGNIRFTEQREKSPTERTKIFQNESVDFTNIVGNVPGIENIRKSPTEQTKIFHDKSMEFTDAVGNIRFTEQREKSPTERTKIFQNESVDFTNIVGNVPGIENIRKSPTEKTKIFHDKSMEFTDAVGNIRFTEQREKSPTERTKIFQNEFVDFTNIVGNFPGIENLRKSPTERTKIFHDKSMEFTDAVGNIRFTKQREKSPTERTKIFQNESVDFTNIVENVPGIENLPKSQMERRTKFNDKSIDLTNIVGNVPEVENPRKSRPERTTIFHDKSMEFTDAVGNIRFTKQREKSPTERTKIFQNESVDFTNIVGNVPGIEKPRESHTERPTIFTDKSMEFTDAVQNVRNTKQRQKSPTEKTKIFHNESVDFTEVVRNLPFTDDRTNRETSPGRSTIFRNESVDFTEGVRNLPFTDDQTNRESSPGRSTIFPNESPDFTEITPDLRSAEKSLPDDPRSARSSMFHDRSSVKSDPSIEKPRHEDSLEQPETHERNILQDRQPQSTEVPEVVQKILRAPKLGSRESSYGLDVRMAIVAKTFVPAVQKPRSEDPEPEIRSPLPKRMKSIGNKSIDLTAAVSFIKLGGKKRQHSEESLDAESTLTPEANDDRLSVKDTDFRNRSMEATEVVAESHPARIFFPSAEEIPIFQNKSAERTFALAGSAERDDESYRMRNATLLGDELMEITGVIPGIVRAENIEIDENPKTTIFHDQSMETTVGVSRPALSRFVPTSGETRPDENGEARSIVFRDDAMELTGAVRPAESPKERFYTNDSEAVHSSDPSKFDHEGKTVFFGDDRMEFTGAVGFNSRTEAPFVDKENCPIGADEFRPRGARLFEHESRIARFESNNGETRTTVFRDDSMDLTGAVRPASNSKERICTNKNEDVHWSDPSEFDRKGKTVFFGDDRMELTGAVGFNSRTEALISNKENCPVAAEDFRPRGSRLFEAESRIASESEWLGKRKNQRNEDNPRVRAESEEQNRVENFGSDDVTGVVPFSSQIDDNEYEGGAEERDYRVSGNDSGTFMLGNESLEMTGVVPWSSDLDVNRRRRPAGGTDDLPTVDKDHQRSSQSQVVKGLFQEPISSDVYAGEKIEPASVNERTRTADLEAEIRKLTESFALEDESGFDQATFLRQQARCMEDYEANSTASQDCEPPAQSAREDARSASDESSDSEKSDDWERTPNTKNANASGRNVSAAESQCFSSKSLEELRNRAYSVGKFQPEATGYELTAAISMPSNDDFHRTIMLEDLQAVEPPSFLGDLADSMRSARSISELPTESQIGGNIAVGEMCRDGEAISRIWEDMPNASLESELTIPDITETVNVDGIVDERRSGYSGERKERKEMCRTQTCEMKKSINDPRITASSEINDERAKNRRRSSTGLTTAEEFSSESADGPSEKLRRGESVLPNEGKVEKSTKLTDIDCSWESKNFASSTVIVDDFTRQMMHRFVESSVILESSLSDELPSAIDANEEENVAKSVRAEEAACHVAMEAEASLCKSPFDALREIIENLAGRSETIWTILRFDEKMLALNFFSNSIVLAIHFNETSDAITNPIKSIGFLSQLVEDGTDPGVSLAHSLIMKKVDSASLTRFYRTYEDIPQMLDFVTMEVKLGMDFMFELDRLRNRNVMEIYGNRIIFIVRTSDINSGIILKLTMEIKPFAEINSNDITISCILGSDKVRENDIKRLITSIKRDHRFLRFYMNDVKDYVDLMAETGFSASSGTGCD